MLSPLVFPEPASPGSAVGKESRDDWGICITTGGATTRTKRSGCQVLGSQGECYVLHGHVMQSIELQENDATEMNGPASKECTKNCSGCLVGGANLWWRWCKLFNPLYFWCSKSNDWKNWDELHSYWHLLTIPFSKSAANVCSLCRWNLGLLQVHEGVGSISRTLCFQLRLPPTFKGMVANESTTSTWWDTVTSNYIRPSCSHFWLLIYWSKSLHTFLSVNFQRCKCAGRRLEGCPSKSPAGNWDNEAAAWNKSPGVQGYGVSGW